MAGVTLLSIPEAGGASDDAESSSYVTIRWLVFRTCERGCKIINQKKKKNPTGKPARSQKDFHQGKIYSEDGTLQG